ncbi:MAG TPA: protoglobin domain-containing protein [Anaeromyxobacteraceae bacterium]|nr:protoglobin domain-containing protein [Anaeromyxobacteraceae bacterium]
MGESLLEELKRYVGFGPDDEAALRALRRAIAPAFPGIAVVFYDRILAHEQARRALTGGESQVGHLRVTLVRWLDETLGGPWDEAYWESHCRIGRVHVRIDLPQHYMFGAMNVVREELHRHAAALPFADPAARERAGRAVDRVLDLELAIMLHTYREDLLARAARTERLATFGQLVGSIGHELRNPLGVIESSVYLLQGRLGEDDRSRKHLERISRQVQVSNEIITGLLDMVRDRPVPRERVELAGLVAAAVEGSPSLPGVTVDAHAPEGLSVTGDQVSLRQALVNLVTNAVEAAAPSGAVRVRARAEDGLAVLEVEDDGPGIPEAVLGRLFEPLVTSKPHGNGLGLALVKRVAERHGGAVVHGPRPGGGTRFTLRLPLP